MQVDVYLEYCKNRVNGILDKKLPAANKEPKKLHEAMRYVALNGGKRMRPALIYATGEALGASDEVLDISSAAIELIHCFSLVIDDLPAIDNDDLRHGKPTCHKVFGEAVAILTGNALLVRGYELLTSLNKYGISSKIVLRMIKILSHYIGSKGMAGGEALDTAINDQNISLQKLANIYKLKTSYLICASIIIGALSASHYEKNLLENLENFGLYIGLAFQIHDDILGITTDTAILGKPQGSDIVKNKPVYPLLVGLEEAKRKEAECFDKAVGYLEKSGIRGQRLIELSNYVIQRHF